MKKESRVKKTMLNAKMNLICYFASFVTAFFTRKILLDHLGAEFIGFTGTVGSLLSFLGLAELGIGTAIGYILYKPIADNDRFKINEVISVLGYLYQKIGYAILGLGLVFSLFLPLIFHDTTISLGVIFFGFYAYLTSSLIGYFVNYRAALLSADQRNYIVTGYFQLTTTLKVILQMVLAIYFGSFYIYFAVETIGGTINAIILNRKIDQTYPWLRSEIKLGKQLFKKYPEITKYTKQIFAHRIGGLVQNQLPPFLIYSFVDLSMVALYTNYTILTQKLEGLISGVINSTGAAIGNLIAEGDKNKTYKVFKELLAIRIFVASLASICIYKFASPLIGVWLGNKYILGNTTVAFVAIISGLTITRGIIDQFIHGNGLYGDTWAPYVESAITLAISLICGSLWGLIGVLCGSLTSITIIIYIWKPYYLFSKGFKLPILMYWKPFAINISASSVAFITTDYIYDKFIQENITTSNWFGLIISGIIYVIMITGITAIVYYAISDGFKDFMHRNKLFKKLNTGNTAS